MLPARNVATGPARKKTPSWVLVVCSRKIPTCHPKANEVCLLESPNAHNIQEMRPSYTAKYRMIAVINAPHFLIFLFMSKTGTS